MRNVKMRMIEVALLLLLVLCSCTSEIVEMPAPTQCATFLPSAPNSTTNLPENAVPWKQTDIFTTWAEHDVMGITRNNTPASVPDSVMNMMPLVEFLLDYRTAYDFQYDDLKFFEDIPSTNQHEIGNEVYLWGLMAHLFCMYSGEHPSVKVPGNGVILHVPEDVARDFLEICFADYTPDFVLPSAPPECWLAAPVGYIGSDPGKFMVFQDGGYVCDAEGISILTGNRQRYIITGAVESDASSYELDIIKLYGPDDYDVAIYHVALSTNSTPNALGLLWRVERIVRIDTSNLWAGQTESGD